MAEADWAPSEDDRLVVLTGAGVSAESGVPTFRGAGGLWRRFRAEDLATPRAFARDPVLVWEWYAWRRGLISECEPNAAHRTLAEMEKVFSHFLLVTQNVDGLHQKAGSQRMVELHGNIWRVRCTREGTVRDDFRVQFAELPPRCECGAVLRPDVVWFGEMLPEGILRRAADAAERCTVMLVVGTSATVQPAASLPWAAKDHGARVIVVNPEPTPLSAVADEVRLGTAGEILPALWAEWRITLGG
jgi:NAD-dependent deacetylase